MYNTCVIPSVCSRLQRAMHQIEYLFDLALRDDEWGQRSQAEKMYTCAIQVALEAVSR